jgi:hypothetical protein
METVKRYTMFKNLGTNKYIVYISEPKKNIKTPEFCIRIQKSFLGKFNETILSNMKNEYEQVVIVA